MPCICRKIFSQATFASEILRLCVASFTTYKASKMTLLKVSVAGTMQDIWKWNYGGFLWGGGLLPRAIHLKKTTFASQLANRIRRIAIYLALWGPPRPAPGITAPCYTCLKRPRRADVDTYRSNIPFSRYARSNGKNRCLRGQNGPPAALLTSHLETPKDIAKKRSTVQDIALPSFKPSRRSVSPSPKYVVGLEYNYCICILQNFTGETKNVLY